MSNQGENYGQWTVIDHSKIGLPLSRVEIESTEFLKFCSTVSDKTVEPFFEIIYSKTLLYFRLYMAIDEQDCREIFHKLRILLKMIEIPQSKVKAITFLQSIMCTYRQNRLWEPAHICAIIGHDAFFKHPEVATQINVQAEPDLFTPLHLSIQYLRESTVRSILALSPNLFLCERKKNTVLHYASIASPPILRMILNNQAILTLMTKRNEHKCTPIHLACYALKHENLFEMLRIGLTVRMLTVDPPETVDLNLDDLLISQPDHPLNKRVFFTEQEISELDIRDMKLGGGPLHWSKNPRLTEKLIEHGMDPNSLNKLGYRPLHNMATRSRIKCVLSLLLAGANVNARNLLDWTPLHCAFKSADIIIIQALIVFDADIDAKTGDGFTVRHMAATQGDSAVKGCLFLVSSLGAKRCSPETKDCQDGCSAKGTYEGVVSQTLDVLNERYDLIYKPFLFEEILKKKLHANPKKPQVNMLSCDGGGIKGLISIQILMEIQRGLSKPINNYFKWMTGTSTGSCIISLLAVGKTLIQARSFYFTLRSRILNGGHKPYSAELYEKFLKNAFTDLQMIDMRTKLGKMIVIPSVLSDRIPSRLHLFRSFESLEEQFRGHIDLLKQVPDLDINLQPKKQILHRQDEFLWRACRASTAAPGYFPSLGPFLDGCFISNNPALDALIENQMYCFGKKALKKFDEVEEIDMCLSIGTAKTQTEDEESVDLNWSVSIQNARNFMNLTNLLVKETCQTEQHIVTRAEGYCCAANIAYFRVNPTLSTLFDIDEQHDSSILSALWETKRYLYSKRDEIKIIQDYLEDGLKWNKKNSKTISTVVLKKSTNKNLVVTEKLKKSSKKSKSDSRASTSKTKTRISSKESHTKQELQQIKSKNDIAEKIIGKVEKSNTSITVPENNKIETHVTNQSKINRNDSF